jgi:hypothetical protein
LLRRELLRRVLLRRVVNARGVDLFFYKFYRYRMMFGPHGEEIGACA